MTASSQHTNIVAISPEWTDVASDLLRGIPSDATLIYEGRNTVYTLQRHGITICVKMFRVPGYINSLVYTRLRQSKAHRSYEYAQRLLHMGFNTPRPLAYAEEKVKGRLRRSIYICEYVESKNMREWEQKPDVDTLLPAFAAEMWHLHNEGVFFKDFSPGNILYTRDVDGNYKFYFVDLNRTRFGVKDEKMQMRNFRSINLDSEQTKRLAREYAHVAGRDPEVVAAEAERQLRRYLQSRRRRQAVKKFFKSKKQ